MKYFADDGNCEIEIEAESPEEAAQEYVDGGSWEKESSTQWIHVYVWGGGIPEDDREKHVITLHPAPPECTENEHEWESPYEVVGGIKENPGVWGHGGGVVITEVCRHCGCYRVTDTWAQDMSDGQQGLESIEYKPADETSRAWVDSLDDGD